MNKCCLAMLQKLQSELANLSGNLIHIAGERRTVMEEAAYRRAEIIIDVMELIKKYAQDETINRKEGTK